MPKLNTCPVYKLVTTLNAVIAVAVIMVMSSCGGGVSSSNLDDYVPNTADDNLVTVVSDTYPELPSDSSGTVTREASAIESLPGSDALMASNGVVAGATLVLTSTTDELAWGLYRLEGLAGRRVSSLTISAIPGELGQNYSVGISNFSEGVWEFLKTATLPEYEYDLTDEQARLISRLGNLYFIIVVSGGDSVTIEQATITSEVDTSGNTDLPPAIGNRPQVSEGLGDRIVITWSAIDGATSYELWRALDMDGMDEQYSLLEQTAETTFTDTNIQLSTEYSYKVRGVNNSGYGRFSEDASGWAGTTPPPGEDNEGNGTQHETFGVVETIDGMHITVDDILFGIDENTQWLDTNDLPVTQSYFSVGMLVEIHSKADGNGGWIANRVEEEELHHGQEHELKGNIENLSESIIVVNETTYAITEDTDWLDDNDDPLTQADFTVGDFVEIEGRLTAEGIWIALEVQKETEHNGETIEEDGSIQNITATNITVNSRIFSHDEHTQWEDGDNNPLTWNDFEVGYLVKVDGSEDGNGGYHASRVRLDD